MRIFTHFNVDLDAVCSVWAVREFVPGAKDAEVVFRPANWDGAEMEKDDIAVDLSAGGRGLKGKQDENGTVHSCFAEIVAQYATPSDQVALEKLVQFVDAQDAHGSAVKFLVPEASHEAQEVLGMTGLNAVLRALQEANPRNDAVVVEKMSEILSGMLKVGRARQRAVAEADRAEVLEGGKVAIVVNSQEFATNGILFDRGVRVIVYVDRNNLGLIRCNGETLRMDHPELRAIVEDAGEADEWFAHPAGFLFCRGSRKAPAKSPSKVDPRVLAETIAHLLE